MLIQAFCKETYEMWQLVGRILLVFKIVIPLLLIIFGMIDLGKAVIASDEKAIKNATTSIIRRLIAAVVIFFIPAIVGAIFSLVKSFSDVENDYNLCKNCIVSPNTDNSCKNAAGRSCNHYTQTGNYYGPDGQQIKDKGEYKSIEARWKSMCPSGKTIDNKKN